MRRPTRSGGSARATTTRCACSCRARGLGGPDAPYLCRALGACGRADDAPLLKQALGADAPAVRRAAAEALAQLPPSTDVDEALTFALADESVDVRASAARALGAHSRGRARRRAGALRARGRAAGARRGVARARARWRRRTRRRARCLRRVADSRDPASAVPALEALARLDDRIDDARFVGALAALDGETVKAAARALALRAPTSPDAVKQSALGALERALADARWDVRRQAALALADFGARRRRSMRAPRARGGPAGARGDRLGAGRRARRALMVAAVGERRLPPEIFRLLRDLIYDYCGIFFAEDNAYIVHRRLQPRLEALALVDFAEYYRYLRSCDPAARKLELEEIVDRVTTNETYFFREGYQLDRVSHGDPARALRQAAARQAAVASGRPAARRARRRTPSPS